MKDLKGEKVLLEHNRNTLAELEMFVSRNENCCVVNPCGSGKTSVMASFIRSHKDKNFLILTKQSNAAKYYLDTDPVFKSKNVRILTYAKMHTDVKRKLIEVYKADFYLLDEAHYIGALNWRHSIQTLIDMYDPSLIGFTATPQRYEDQGSSHTIVDDFFEGNIAGNYSVSMLEEKGVFVKPEYVLSVFNMDRIIENKMNLLVESDISEAKKTAFSEKLRCLLNDWEKTGKPSVVFSEYLPDYMYKEHCNRILVYVSDMKDIYKKQEAVDKDIRNVFPKKSIKSYVYTYKTAESVLADFLTEDNTDIKILYSIDKIMETIHIQDLRIMIMLRPSVSGRIITQQFGRINSIGNKNRPLVIDMVGNLDNLRNLRTPSFPKGDNEKSDKKEKPNKRFLFIRSIDQVFDVFAEIDKAAKIGKSYTYNGFTGSLQDICYIYRRDYKQVKELLDKDYCLEDAIKTAYSKGNKFIRHGVGTLDSFPQFTMTEEQKEYAQQKYHIYADFITRKQIDDEDICQDLYIKFCQSVVEVLETKNFYTASSKIISDMHLYYIQTLRQKYMHEASICELECMDTLMQDDIYDMYAHKFDERKHIEAAMRGLTERERRVTKLYFGFDDTTQLTLEDVAKELGVTRERVRQILMKALRKVRGNKRVRNLYDYVQ